MKFLLIYLLYLAEEVYSLNREECGVSLIHNYGNRIVGGRDALKGEYPWMASLQVFDGETYNHWCGGVILNKHWILTAGHCLTSIESIDLMRVLVGTNHISNNEFEEEGKHYSVEKFIVHEYFVHKPPKNDIALLRIHGEMKVKAKGMINSICLPHYHQYLDRFVTVTGWGISDLWREEYSTSLQSIDLVVNPPDYCKKKWTHIRDTEFCAGSQLAKDSCAGDSGGPAIQFENNKAIVVGIVSHGNSKCGQKDWPGVYTEVSKYLDWIHNAINQ